MKECLDEPAGTGLITGTNARPRGAGNDIWLGDGVEAEGDGIGRPKRGLDLDFGRNIAVDTRLEKRASLSAMTEMASSEQTMWNSVGRETCMSAVLSGNRPSRAESWPNITRAKTMGAPRSSV